MEAVLGQEQEHVCTQLMVFQLCYDNLARSLAVLQDYQANCQDTLDWQFANNILLEEFLPFWDESLPSSDDSFFEDDEVSKKTD